MFFVAARKFVVTSVLVSRETCSRTAGFQTDCSKLLHSSRTLACNFLCHLRRLRYTPVFVGFSFVPPDFGCPENAISGTSHLMGNHGSNSGLMNGLSSNALPEHHEAAAINPPIDDSDSSSGLFDTSSVDSFIAGDSDNSYLTC